MSLRPVSLKLNDDEHKHLVHLLHPDEGRQLSECYQTIFSKGLDPELVENTRKAMELAFKLARSSRYYAMPSDYEATLNSGLSALAEVSKINSKNILSLSRHFTHDGRQSRAAANDFEEMLLRTSETNFMSVMGALFSDANSESSRTYAYHAIETIFNARRLADQGKFPPLNLAMGDVEGFKFDVEMIMGIVYDHTPRPLEAFLKDLCTHLERKKPSTEQEWALKVTQSHIKLQPEILRDPDHAMLAIRSRHKIDKVRQINDCAENIRLCCSCMEAIEYVLTLVHERENRVGKKTR